MTDQTISQCSSQYLTTGYKVCPKLKNWRKYVFFATEKHFSTEKETKQQQKNITKLPTVMNTGVWCDMKGKWTLIYQQYHTRDGRNGDISATYQSSHSRQKLSSEPLFLYPNYHHTTRTLNKHNSMHLMLFKTSKAVAMFSWMQAGLPEISRFSIILHLIPAEFPTVFSSETRM